ncbi:hypothetical protein BaRGS_00009396 [Batillaria attramentaria]|uniref:Uncharacterized protein n=1 Tax=Batillaria attramentaria TaxID=370345 RepID=A0ABD0LIS9_9CAEN
MESGDADRTPPSAPNPHSSQWMKLLEDCTELLHTLPLSLQEPSRRFDSRLGTSDMDTGPRSHESRAPPQGDSVGELTALLDTCGLHDLPPTRDPVLKTKLVDLIRRYHALRSSR